MNWEFLLTAATMESMRCFNRSILRIEYPAFHLGICKRLSWSRKRSDLPAYMCGNRKEQKSDDT